MLRAMDGQDKPFSEMSEAELWEPLLGPPYRPGESREPEFLGEYSLEEAEQMGAFFDDPADLEEFEQALAEEKARKASAN